MYEFGDELIIDSYRIPWLIWIQLLAMFLLLILICYFTATDLSLHFTSADDSLPPPSSFANHAFITSVVDSTTRHNNSKLRENEIKETGTSTSEAVQRIEKPDGRPRAESSTSNESSDMIYEHSHHPCHFFGIAKHVFLKCLGFDSTHEKED